jgi:excisionase family DNA binding protein
MEPTERADDNGSEMTVREAAQYAEVNPQTIRNWIRSGKLVARRYGPSGWNIAIKKEDLDEVKAKH